MDQRNRKNIELAEKLTIASELVESGKDFKTFCRENHLDEMISTFSEIRQLLNSGYFFSVEISSLILMDRAERRRLVKRFESTKANPLGYSKQLQ